MHIYQIEIQIQMQMEMHGSISPSMFNLDRGLLRFAARQPVRRDFYALYLINFDRIYIIFIYIFLRLVLVRSRVRQHKL